MQTIKVGEVCDPNGLNSLVVSDESDLKEIISQLATHPSTQGVFLVDSQQRFAGVITRVDLLKWASLRLGRRAGPRQTRISRSDVVNLILSTRARDIAEGDWRTLGVKPGDDLDKALSQMLDRDAIDIPVLDDHGKIIGDLRVSQVLRTALQSSEGNNPRA